MGASGNLSTPVGAMQTPYAQWGATGAGIGSDIFSLIGNIQAGNRASRVSDIMTNPNKLAAAAAKLYGGLSGPARDAAGRDLNAQWASATGGAPGGAQAQFLADAFAKIESQGYMDALSRYISSVGGAPGLPTSPMGATGNVLRSLAVLSQLRGGGGGGGGLVAQSGEIPGITPQALSLPYEGSS